MTSSIWLRDLASYGLQVALLVAAGALLARLFRLRATTATLVYWQALLAVCLILPVCQPWKTDVVRTAVEPTAGVAAAANASSTPLDVPAPASRSVPWPIERTVLLIIMGGILVRGLWLATGFWGLARLRRQSSVPPAALESLLGDAQRLLEVHAEFRASVRAAAPITFGLRRPTILLPANVCAMEREALRAIVYHELLHVRRRDWAWSISEESIRTALWFHPAIWWLIGRIRLTREQLVDQAVIELTASRERYVEVLLAVAQAKTHVSFGPAPLFLRKGLLKKRVAEIFKETTMTQRRLILCLAASAFALVLVGRTAVSLFPLRAHAQELNSSTIQVVQGGDNLLHRAALVYPRSAIQKGVERDVALEVSVDDQGQVSDARVLSGPEELRRPCLQSVLEWRFQLPKDEASSEVVLPAIPEECDIQINGEGVSYPEAVYAPNPPYPDEAKRAGKQGTVALRVTLDTEGKVTEAHIVKALDPLLDESAIEAVQTWRFKPPTKDGQPVTKEIEIEISFCEEGGSHYFVMDGSSVGQRRECDFLQALKLESQRVALLRDARASSAIFCSH